MRYSSDVLYHWGLHTYLAQRVRGRSCFPIQSLAFGFVVLQMMGTPITWRELSNIPSDRTLTLFHELHWLVNVVLPWTFSDVIVT